jgi:hypothetical protein
MLSLARLEIQPATHLLGGEAIGVAMTAERVNVEILD